MGKSIGILIVLLGLYVLASIMVETLPFDNMVKTILGILLVMFGIAEMKENVIG